MKLNRKSIIGSLGIVSFLLMSNFQDTEALGSRVRAMGGAFIGLANDENAIFSNPAGLSQLSGNHYHLDVLLNSRNEFTNDSFAYASQIYEGQSRKRFSIEEYLENEFQLKYDTMNENYNKKMLELKEENKKLNNLIRQLEHEVTKIEVRKEVSTEINKPKANILEENENIEMKIEDKKKVFNIPFDSSNQDEEIKKMVKEAINKVENEN